MKNTITCRHCKEQNNWEIENQSGVVLDKITPSSGKSYILFSLYNSTTGRPAAIISNGILDGFDALMHTPTLHLL